MCYSGSTQKLLREFDIDVSAYITGYTGAIAIDVGYKSTLPIDELVLIAMVVFIVAYVLSSRLEHIFDECCKGESDLVRSWVTFTGHVQGGGSGRG